MKATKTEGKLTYFCEVCVSKLDRMRHEPDILLLEGVLHITLRCPVCGLLYSAKAEDCGN